MAMTYQNFASLGVNLNRQKYGPLDISNVFTSAADLKYYLTKGTYTEGVSEYWYKNANEKIVPYPYEGQVLATVIDGVVSVFALSLDAEGNFQTQEIGAKVEVDGTTIVKDANGKLSIVAPVEPDDKKTYNFAYANGVYSWVEVDTATAAGQAQAIQGLTDRTVALETVVNGKTETTEGAGDGVVGLVDKVAALEAVDNATQAELDAYKEVVTAAIAAGIKEAKDYADAQDADTIYNDTALANRVTALEGVVGDAEDGLVKDVADNAQAITDLDAAYKAADTTTLSSAKTYTDEEIAGLTVVIEQKEGVEFIVVRNKAGEEVASANASKFVQDSFLNDVAYDDKTGKVSFTWTMGDGSTKTDEIDIAHLVDTYTAGNGLTVTDNEFAVDTDVIATVEALGEVRDIAEAAQTAAEVSDAIDAKITEANLGQYAKATDVENTFADYYTKDDVDGKCYAVATEVADTYATQEALSDHASAAEATYAKAADVEAELAKKIETGSIAHSTDEKAEGVTVDGTKLDIVVDAFTKAETRQYVADTIKTMTGGESAADVKLLLENHIDAYEEKVGQIDTKNGEQDTAIAAAKSQADKGVADAAAAATAVSDLENGAVKTNAENIAAIQGRLTPLETAKGDHETRIATAEGKITALEGADVTINATLGTLSGNVTDLANEDSRLAGLITALESGKADASSVYTKTEVDNKVQAAIDAIPDVDLAPYAKTADVDATIKVVNAAIAEKANAADVYTKDEAAAAFMSEGEVDARINALINAADPEGGKTISDIQNLVKYVEENAGEIAGLVTSVGNNTTAIEKNADDIAAIDESIVAINKAIKAIVQPKESDEVSVGEDGTLGVKAVNVNKLIQTEGDELILNGGKASKTAQ